MGFKNLNIRGKMLAALLILAICAFTLTCYLAMLEMRTMGNFAIENCDKLGEEMVENSKQMLIEQYKKELSATAAAQSRIVSLQLNKVSSKIKMAGALYATTLEQADRKDITTAAELVSEFKPRRPEDFSCYNIAPSGSRKKLLIEREKTCVLHPVLKMIYESNPDFSLVFYATRHGSIMCYPWAKMPDNFDSREREWFRKAMRHHHRICWTDPYISGKDNELIMTCALAVCNRDDKPLGIAGIDFNISDMAKSFAGSIVNKDADYLVVNSKGDIIISPSMKNQGLKWSEHFGRENIFRGKYSLPGNVKRQFEQNKNNTLITKNAAGEEILAAFAPVKTVKWHLVIIMPLHSMIGSALLMEKKIIEQSSTRSKTIDSLIADDLKLFIILALAATAVILLFGMIISRKITEPIRHLTTHTKLIGSGQLRHKVSIDSGDELEELGHSFNKMAGNLAEYIRNLNETTAAKERIEQELAVANAIQRSMLPKLFPPFPNCDQLDIYALMEPAKQVGGDFYDFFMVDDHTLFFAIGDVSGKGIPAALFMAITKTLIGHEALNLLEPHEIIMRVNNALEKDNDACMFATVFCGYFDANSGKVSYCNAGHNPPLVYYRSQDAFEFLTPNRGIPVGVMPMDETTCITEEMYIEYDDMLFLYSDGVTEAMNRHGMQFSEDRLQDHLNRLKNEALTEILSDLRVRIHDHADGEEQSDDITMLAIRYVEKHPDFFGYE